MKSKYLLVACLGLSAWAQERQGAQQALQGGAGLSVPTEAFKDAPPAVTTHEIVLNGKPLKYTATAHMMPIRNNTGEVEAGLFYVAYTVENNEKPNRRPLCIAFNGGPGAGSLWLHLGAIGPRRIRMNDDGSMPPPPYRMEDNQGTWLDKCDLVFVDPVGTGFSRATNAATARKYNGFTGDIDSVGEFIRLYLARNNRFLSPLFLAGESYGTTRAAGLSGALAARGVGLNGVVLISSILNFQTARFTKGNDLPFILFLPTYSAIAWYHKKADSSFKDQKTLLKEARAFAEGEYATALMKGDKLSPAEREQIATKLAKFTGLSKTFLLQNDLRIEISRFCKELLRDKATTVGRLDGRLTGTDGDNGAATFEFDPSQNAIMPPYTHAMNQYAREDLGFKTDSTYFSLGGGILPWDYSNAQNQFADTSNSLRIAFDRNPHMKVFVANGYYDLATPFFATEYTFSHLGLNHKLKGNISMGEYEAGHMMYIHVPSLLKLKSDVASFIDSALPK